NNVRDRHAVRAGEDNVLAAAAGKRAPGQWQLAVLPLKRSEAFVPAVARVDVDHHQLVGTNREIGVGNGQPEPPLDHVGVVRGGVRAVRGELAMGMLRRLLATQPSTSADRLAVVRDWPPQWKHVVAAALPGVRVEEGGVAHAFPLGSREASSTRRMAVRKSPKESDGYFAWMLLSTLTTCSQTTSSACTVL